MKVFEITAGKDIFFVGHRDQESAKLFCVYQELTDSGDLILAREIPEETWHSYKILDWDLKYRGDSFRGWMKRNSEPGLISTGSR